MSKVTVTSPASFVNDASAVAQETENLAAITAAIENTLSRDGTGPNQMLAPLDMNSERIINLPAPSGPNDPVRFQDTFAGNNNLFQQTGTGAVPYPFSAKVGQLLSVKDFGAVGDGEVDDYNAIMTAHAAAVAAGKGLFWPDGNYRTSLALNFSNGNTRHVNLGNATITFTGAGPAISFDAGVTSGNIFDISFGSREYPFKIVGNANATYATFVRAVHHSSINIIARDFSEGAMVVNFAVCSQFFVKMSQNDGGAFDVAPAACLITGVRNAGEAVTLCKFEIIAEGIAGTGLQLASARVCRFWGTSEGNTGGGVFETTGSRGNIFEHFTCEANGITDWILFQSEQTVLHQCGGGSNVGGLWLSDVDKARIVGGYFRTIKTDADCTRCDFEDTEYLSTWTMSSTTSTWRNVYKGSVFLTDKYTLDSTGTGATVFADAPAFTTSISSPAYKIGSSTVLGSLSNFMTLSDLAGTAKIFLGNTAAANANTYLANSHVFKDVTSGAAQLTVSTSGLSTPGAYSSAVPVTITAATATMAANNSDVIFNTSATHTYTLLSAATNPGRELHVKNIAAFAVNSASSNVVPLAGGAASTAILVATAGKWARLKSDGTNWVVMAAG